MENEWDSFMNRCGELFRVEILRQNQLELSSTEGAAWTVKNQIAAEIGTKYVTALLLEMIFFDTGYYSAGSKNLYFVTRKHLRERHADPLFFRYVFKIQSKQLFGEQIRLKKLMHYLVSEATGRPMPKVANELFDVQEESKELSMVSSIQKKKVFESSFDNSFEVSALKEVFGSFEDQKLQELTLQNTPISPETIQLVNNPNKIGDAKIYLTELQNKTRKVNPRFEKESEINKVFRVRCSYQFGPNQYTHSKVLISCVGEQTKIQSAQKEAAKNVVKILFERYPAVMSEVPLKSPLQSKDSIKI